MSERKIMNQIQVALSKFKARLFRNQVGTYKLPSGNYVSSGLCIGSSDLIGWHSVVVTPKMVGSRVAIFTAVEVKTSSGKLTKEQVNFIQNVKMSGGVAFVATSIEEAVTKLFKESPLANGTGY